MINFKPLPFVVVFSIFLLTTVAAQPTARQVTISVKGIEYDDSHFTALRETLKRNPKVKTIKPSYVEGEAILLFTYAGEPSQLWDEIPRTHKAYFKMDQMDDNSISLSNTGAPKNSSNSDDGPTTTTSTNKTKNKKDCFDCEYYPMCEFDLTKSYGGKVYHGSRNDDESVDYYYCENGVLTKKWDYTVNVVKGDAFNGFYDDVEKRVGTMIIMKSNVPVGTTWTGGSGSSNYSFTLAAKGVKVSYKDKTYSDVIKIKANDSYYYYAKNVGYLGTDVTEVGTPTSFAPFKLGARDLAASCKNWCGTWQLVEDNGKKYLPNDVTPYMQLLDDGDGATFSLQIKPDKKLHLVGKGVALMWGPWSEQAGIINYINYNSQYRPSEKGLAIDPKSVPLRILIIGTRTYKYYGDDIFFSE